MSTPAHTPRPWLPTFILGAILVAVTIIVATVTNARGYAIIPGLIGGWMLFAPIRYAMRSGADEDDDR